MDTKRRAAVRICIALKMCSLFRQAVEKNQNVYHGGLVPNLTSVTDSLTIPYDLLISQTEKHPELKPTERDIVAVMGIL